MSEALVLDSVRPDTALKTRVFESLRSAILAMDVYAEETPPKLDERHLAEALGVSRTPVREALSRLEQEGLVRNVPRRGTFVVRKSRQEIVAIIEVWAALESMAARLATQVASEEALIAFGERGAAHGDAVAHGGTPIDDYSERNIAFHQNIIELSGNAYLLRTARASFDHMRMIRSRAIRDPGRSLQSVIDHGLIVEALLARRAACAERLVREHALSLARHVEQNADFLD